MGIKNVADLTQLNPSFPDALNPVRKAYHIVPVQVTRSMTSATKVAVLPADATVTNFIAYNPTVPNITLLSVPSLNNATTVTTGGTLAAGTYYYVITATNAAGETTKSNEVSIVTTGTTSTNTVTWTAVTGATGYKIYRGTASGQEGVFYSVGAVTTFSDTGAANTAGTPPTTNTTGSAIITFTGQGVGPSGQAMSFGSDNLLVTPTGQVPAQRHEISNPIVNVSTGIFNLERPPAVQTTGDIIVYATYAETGGPSSSGGPFYYLILYVR